MTVRRRIGDRRTLMVKVDTDGVTVSEKPDDVIETSAFQLRVIEDEIDRRCLRNGVRQGPIARYHFSYEVFWGNNFRYEYIIPENIYKYNTRILEYRRLDAEIRRNQNPY